MGLQVTLGSLSLRGFHSLHLDSCLIPGPAGSCAPSLSKPCSRTMGFHSLVEGSPVAVHPHALVTCCALWKTQSLHPGGALEEKEA